MSHAQYLSVPVTRQTPMQASRMKLGFAVSTFSLLAGLLYAAWTDILALLSPVWRLLQEVALETKAYWERLVLSIQTKLDLLA